MRRDTFQIKRLFIILVLDWLIDRLFFCVYFSPFITEINHSDLFVDFFFLLHIKQNHFCVGGHMYTYESLWKIVRSVIYIWKKKGRRVFPIIFWHYPTNRCHWHLTMKLIFIGFMCLFIVLVGCFSIAWKSQESSRVLHELSLVRSIDRSLTNFS